MEDQISELEKQIESLEDKLSDKESEIDKLKEENGELIGIIKEIKNLVN